MQTEENIYNHSRRQLSLVLWVLVELAAGLLLTGITQAEVPSTISYQGKLSTPAGAPVADGVYQIAFRIYDDLTGGNLFWEELKSVTVRNGSFSAQLGETIPLDQSTLSIPNLHLAIKIGADAESSPRSRLNVVPYATLVGTVEGAAGGMIFGDLTATGQVSGSSSNGSGGYFQSYKTAAGSQNGLVGKYMAIGSQEASGVYGYSRGQDNFGIGGDFEGGFIGVRGKVSPTGTNGGLYRGILGSVTATVPRSDIEVVGVTGSATDALSSVGVHGYAGGVFAGAVANSYGVRGLASGVGTAAVNYGVYAHAEGGWANYGIFAQGSTRAAFFLGDVQVLGSLSKLGGSFKIDHPLDPANKYLQHSFVESPDMMNIYNGNITLDTEGKATVVLPDWFDALNRDFRYQLTAVGAPGPNLFVAKKMIGNQFSIAGGEAGMEVSWQITGVRKDVWAEAHRIQVEVPKEADKLGTYLNPELFGKPENMGETYEMAKPGRKVAN